MIVRATLNFVMEWESDKLFVPPNDSAKALLLEVLNDQPEKDLFDMITVERIEDD